MSKLFWGGLVVSLVFLALKATGNGPKGGLRIIGGKAEQAWGRLTGDQKAQFEGGLNQAVGKVEQKASEASARLKDTFEDVAGKVQQGANNASAQAKGTLEDVADEIEQRARE